MSHACLHDHKTPRRCASLAAYMAYVYAYVDAAPPRRGRRPPQATSPSTTCTASARRPTPGRRCRPPAPAPPHASPWASRRRPTGCSTSSGAGTEEVTWGRGGQLIRCMCTCTYYVHKDAVYSIGTCAGLRACSHMRRARVPPPLYAACAPARVYMQPGMLCSLPPPPVDP